MALALYNYHTSYDQAVEYASEAAEIASEIGDTGMKWSALKNLSMLFTTLGDIARGFEFFHQALEIADKHFDERRIFKTIYDCSCNEVAPHLYDPYIRRALSLVYVMPRLKHFLYINYAQMLSRMGRIAESKEYVDAFISALPAAPDKDRAKNHNQLGIYYFENGDSINASIEFERAIELGIIPPDARCVHCRMGQIYSKTDPHRALTHLLKSIEISDVYTDWTDANCNHGHLADLYQSLGEIDKAAEHFLIYKKITEESKLKEEGLRAEYAGIIHRFEESQKHERLLAEEVKAKSTALTEKAMLLAEQTELLANFRDEMRALLSKVEANDPAINEIRRKLRSLPEAVNWKEFDEQFQSVHPQFQEVLRENYPALTKMELKNCVLLRLNLNSRDISKLLCLSKRTIESHRHSIRKKLGIKPEEDVAIFLQRI
jgi:tetratricopeptide (TPR) repeat protein